MSKLPYLNLGCGSRYSPLWTNIDFQGKKNEIIGHNLLAGIPFETDSFEVVYHSHVLEHFSKTDGRNFVTECFRVLKKNGIIRIAIPNLEEIVRQYIKNMEGALAGDREAADNYEWIMMEMYDQAVRHSKGGHMLAYLLQENLPNKQYITQRIGREAEAIWAKNQGKENKSLFSKIKGKPVSQLVSIGWGMLNDKIKSKYYSLGRYRLGGEIHQWMYDRYSLKKLLEDIGFTNVKVQTAISSDIPDWQSFNLDTNSKGEVNKPDSLFIEARKL